jgi:hypothetical protein
LIGSPGSAARRLWSARFTLVARAAWRCGIVLWLAADPPPVPQSISTSDQFSCLPGIQLVCPARALRRASSPFKPCSPHATAARCRRNISQRPGGGACPGCRRPASCRTECISSVPKAIRSLVPFAKRLIYLTPDPALGCFHETKQPILFRQRKLVLH